MISRHTLHLLEYDRLLEIISADAHSDVTRIAVLDIAPFESGDHIHGRFSFLDDIRTLYRIGKPLHFQPFQDIAHHLDHVRPAGAVLDASDIFLFVPVLDMAYEISNQISDVEGLAALPELTAALTGQPELLDAIRRSIDHEGNIKDSASTELARIRRIRRRLEQGIQKRLEEMSRDAALSVFLQDDFVTRRAGRWVIPVRMDSKGLVPGVVHDVSKSGETAFIEPLAIIHLSNELENLYAEEKAEELRILRVISAGIRDKADGISDEFQILVTLDLLNCIALFAGRLRCEIPEVTDSGPIQLVNARHPLLEFSLQKAERGQNVVPLSLNLGGENKVMVITGSNAGGKTIAIKTVGLILCMALSGIPVPADDTSQIPLVRSVLVDMGDEQSIESHLSTFSAHITNIAGILETSDDNTLVLIDELGTGTDPEEGSALACAVLRELHMSGALVFATTHLMGIKGYVQRQAGMVNASMEFDKNTLTPLYRLRTGEPGQSHALDIAGRYGISERVIRAARELLSGSTLELDELIADLNRKRTEYGQRLDELQRREAELEARAGQLEQSGKEVEKRRKEILADAYRDAEEMLSDLKRQLRLELEETRKKDRLEKQAKLRELEQRQKAVSAKAAEFEEALPLGIDDIAAGDTVYVTSLGYDAVVTGILQKGERVKVTAGSKDFLVQPADLRVKTGKKPPEKREQTPSPALSIDEAAPSSINLVGLRVEEALSRVEPFLNHVSLAGFREVVIIHGIGTGALKRAIREHLTGHPLVTAFRAGEQSEGGGGVTVVTLA